jgi:hypothetical protein
MPRDLEGEIPKGGCEGTGTLARCESCDGLDRPCIALRFGQGMGVHGLHEAVQGVELYSLVQILSMGQHAAEHRDQLAFTIGRALSWMPR